MAAIRLILASSSARRRELLARVGIAHEILPSRIDETPRPAEDPRAYARWLAVGKAEEIAKVAPTALVLGADTVVELDGEALGKPAGAEQARDMLSRLSHRRHFVTTAVALVSQAGRETLAVTTEVAMRSISAAELDAYVAAGEWEGKAGGYAIQGMAAAFVAEVRGSVTNVIGLPLAEVIELLARAGGPSPDYRAGVSA